MRPLQKTKILLVLLLLLCLLGSLTGCSKEKRTEPEASGNQWPGDDTTITLYQHETGETVEISLRE